MVKANVASGWLITVWVLAAGSCTVTAALTCRLFPPSGPHLSGPHAAPAIYRQALKGQVGTADLTKKAVFATDNDASRRSILGAARKRFRCPWRYC